MILFNYLAFLLLISLLFVYLERLSSLFIFLFLFVLVFLLKAFSIPNIILVAISLLFLFIWALMSITVFRLWLIQNFLRKPLLNLKVSISQTEQIAMESGQTHWDKNLFCAQLKWDKLLAVNTVSFNQTEQDFIDVEVPALIKQFYQDGLTQNTLERLKKKGFWSFNIPKKYGGLDFSAKAHANILTKISSCDISLAVTVMVPNSLGPAELILHYGTDEQKQDLLPKLATGEHIPCFALSSTQAGSDAGAMLDTGVVCYRKHKGEKTLGLVLNWQKRYTTLAPIATLIGLAFKTYDPNGLLGGKKSLGFSCALVEADLAGISIGRYHHPIGANFANGPHQGKDVFIPLSNVIGGQKMLGQGWKMLMESLSLGRGVSLPSLSLAGMQKSLKTSIEYGFIRTQFRQNLTQFQGIAEQIVSMASDVFQALAMSDFHLSLLDKGLNPSVSSAILKYHHTQALRTCINAGMDIAAGKAVMLGSKNYLANIYQTIPIAITVEGANILTRSMIIFGQGLLRCHPFLKEEVASLSKQNITKFNDLIGQHLRHIVLLKTKSFIYNLIPDFATLPKTHLSNISKPYYQKLTGLSAGFALLIEVALVKYGQKLKFQESLNGLFSDVLIHLYALSTTLKFYEQNTLDNQQLLMQWNGQSQVHKIQLILLEICQKLPFSYALKIAVLPKGISPAPSIKQQTHLMQQLIHNADLKNQLTQAITLPDKNQPLSKLEQTFNLSLEAQDLYQKYGVLDETKQLDDLLAKGDINQEEFALLTKLITLKADVLSVDDYKTGNTRYMEINNEN